MSSPANPVVNDEQHYGQQPRRDGERPAHDQRDLDFARKYGLPVPRVVAEGDLADPTFEGDTAYTGPGRIVNSGPLDGLDVESAKRAVIERAEAEDEDKRAVVRRERGYERRWRRGRWRGRRGWGGGEGDALEGEGARGVCGSGGESDVGDVEENEGLGMGGGGHGAMNDDVVVDVAVDVGVAVGGKRMRGLGRARPWRS